MATKTKSGKGRKAYKFGGVQEHGNSRKAYFAIAPFRIAANKLRRIKKEAALQQKYKDLKD